MPFKKKEKQKEEGLDLDSLSAEEIEEVLERKKELEAQKQKEKTTQAVEEAINEEPQTTSKSNATLIFQRYARLLQDKERQINKRKVEEKNPVTKERKTMNEVIAEAEDLKVTLAEIREGVGFNDMEVKSMLDDVKAEKYTFLVED